MYLDTAILVKLLVREADSSYWASLVDGQVVWASQLILTECFSALLRKEREKSISAAHRRRAFGQVERDVAAGRLNLVSLSPEIFASANTILDSCHPHIALRSLDALHLAAARVSASGPLCTNDQRLRAAAERLAIPLCPLPPPARR